MLEMLKQSRWSWRGSSLDPEFKRPKIKLRRGKGDSDSSSRSSHSGGGPVSKVLDSDEELFFPEESQAKYVAKRCPGLLAKMGLQRCRKTLCDGMGLSLASRPGLGSVLPPVSLASQPVAPIGKRGFVALCGPGPALRGGGRPRAGCQHATPEIPRSHHARETPGALTSQPVAPIGKRGFVALCGHGPALRGGGRPRAGCQHATPEIPRSHHARETPGGGIKDGVDPRDPQQRGHRRGAPYGCKRAEAGRAFAGLRGEAPLGQQAEFIKTKEIMPPPGREKGAITPTRLTLPRWSKGGKLKGKDHSRRQQ